LTPCCLCFCRMGGCQASKTTNSGEVDITETFEKVEFDKLDLEPIDATFSKASAVFDEVRSVNTRLVDGVQAVLKSQTAKETTDGADQSEVLSMPAKLAQHLQTALLGARDAMEDALPENKDEIRQKAMEAKYAALKAAEAKGADQNKLAKEAKAKATEVQTLVHAALPKMTTLLPKVEGSSISFPEGFKMEKLTPDAKAAMDKVKEFFELLKEIGTEALAALKTKIEDVMAEINKLSLDQVKEFAMEKTKDMGAMDKVKYLKQRADMLTKNSKLSTTLKALLEKLVKQLEAICKILVDAFMFIGDEVLKAAPGIIASVNDAAADALASVKELAETKQDALAAPAAPAADAPAAPVVETVPPADGVAKTQPAPGVESVPSAEKVAGA